MDLNVSSKGEGGRSRPMLTANDRFKGAWSRRAVLATLLSAGLHVLLLLLSPSWSSRSSLSDFAGDFLQLESVRAMGLEFVPFDFGVSGSVTVLDAELEAELGGDTDADVSGRVGSAQEPGGAGGLAGLSDLLRGRTPSGAALVATLTEPEEEGTEELAVAEADGEASEGVGLGSVGTSAALPEWLAVSEMELDRLASVRPEIVHVFPSAHILIRNPSEVDLFIRRSRDRGAVDPEFEGSVQIALWIDERGSVEWAEVSASSGQADADRFALSLFSEVISFRPARERGIPVPVSMTFQLHFPFH